MYQFILNIINNRNFDLAKILAKIDTFYTEDKLTATEREQLYNAARNRANPDNSIDNAAVHAKLVELEQRIAALENAATAVSPASGEPEDFIEGKWYYRGNRVRFNNKRFECVAPAGVVCVWSPDAYPVYWQEIT